MPSPSRSPFADAESNRQGIILIVDDAPQNLAVLGELLRPHYRVRAANSGSRALRAARSTPRPELILLDVMMPEMDGHEVLRRLRADLNTRDIPVIFVTAMDSAENEELGLRLGAVDYITKPINPAIMLARVRTQIELKQARDRLSSQNQWLETEIARRMHENQLIQDLSIRALATLAEVRDIETGHHILRTQRYVEILANALSAHPRFREALADSRLGMVVKAAPLHDIGKVGIPDAILRKPGRLTTEEFKVMQTHPQIGAEAIHKALAQVMEGAGLEHHSHSEHAFDFLEVASEIALGHHEKWDGSGYPEGLVGDAIPVSARLMALADVFDALISRRVYKPAMALEKAHAILVDGRGSHFDPAVVDAFLNCEEQFAEIATRYPDPEANAE